MVIEPVLLFFSKVHVGFLFFFALLLAKGNDLKTCSSGFIRNTIMWQSSPEVNPRVMIGSFLTGSSIV